MADEVPSMSKSESKEIDVSVIIVSWNTQALLKSCLESIRMRAGDVNLEIIVVDNASSDGSSKMVKREFPDVKLLQNSTNGGYAAAVNMGLLIGKGRYFLVLNSDTEIFDRAIEKCVGYSDEHPDVAVTGCQVWEDETTVQITCFQFPSLLNLILETCGLNRLFRHNRFFGREWMVWWDRDSERVVDVVSGMFMLVRCEAVEQVGPMDEDYFLLFEETDWCYRFHRAGWKNAFWPGARIMHVHGGSQSIKQVNVKMMVQFRKSMLIFFRKHRSYPVYLLARLILSGQCLLRTMAWGLIWVWRSVQRHEVKHANDKTRGYWGSLKYCLAGVEATK